MGFDAGLVSLDQEKAFDRVEHRYLWNILPRFSLSSGLIAKIKVLYEDIESVLKMNGCLCKPFKVNKTGLFNFQCSLQFLLNQCCKMFGLLLMVWFYLILGHIFILSAYADDIIVIVRNTEEVTKLGKIVEFFGKISATKVNWAKSEALAVGRSAGLPHLPGGLSWRRGGLKYLGVYLGDYQTVEKNWEGVVEKVEGRLAKWRWLLPQMSYRGRSPDHKLFDSINSLAQVKMYGAPCWSTTQSAVHYGKFWGQLALGSTECTLPDEGRGGAGVGAPGEHSSSF